MYLTAEAVDETLAFVAENSCEGSSIIFNYVLESVIDGSHKLKLAKKWKEYLGRLGEQLTFGIAEVDLEDYLLRRGFCQVRNVNYEFLKGYFTKVDRKQEVWPFLLLARATVKPRG
jgi:O-methyltransferase involved in polyketide biosynthesis